MEEGADHIEEKRVEKVKIRIDNISFLPFPSPYFSSALKTRGDIYISCGHHILTRSDDESKDFLNDAVVYVLLELHRIVSHLFYTSISWRVEGKIGVRFIYNRYALLFYGGVCSQEPKITILVYDSRRHNETPLLKIQVTPEEIAEAVQCATSDLLQKFIILENEAMNTDYKTDLKNYLEAGEEMKRSPLYKELAFSYLKTEMILNEHRTITQSRTKKITFFNFQRGFATSHPWES